MKRAPAAARLRQAHGGRETGVRWRTVFSEIPPHQDAPSTLYYRACEQRLFTDFIGPLPRKRVMKTDLWDEARNTRILQWVTNEGGRPYGIDVSAPTAEEARNAFRGDGLAPGFTIADVRKIPFRDNSFDVVYSMGTIEHFPETEDAVREIFRVLRPGGTAIIGVPNKLDPFLRPLLVTVLNWFDAYPYGMEKSYTRRQLASMAERAGFRVRDVSSVLFMPGLLRIVDLMVHTRWPRMAWITGLLTRPFALLYERSRIARRHGYLIACIAEKQ